MTILDRLAEHAGKRVALAKSIVSTDTIRKQAEESPAGNFAFEKALKTRDIAFICECKKASPSKGIIAPDFDHLKIAKEYEEGGAECISVLTEPRWFLGSNRYLTEVADKVKVPCLRKDFTVDEYMIYEAKVLKASAVLLICSILTPKQLKEYITLCDKLGLSALVEIHDKAEADMAIDAGARLIGVNNRDLKSFEVDTDNSCKLRSMVPSDILFVAESGVSCRADVNKLRQAGADALLIGEALMRAEDKKKMIAGLRGED